MTRLPVFSNIQTACIEPALDELLNEYRQLIEQLTQQTQTPGWNSVIDPLEQMDNRLQLFWSPVSHLKAVKDSEDLREAYNRCLPKLTEFSSEMGQNEALYHLYEQVAEHSGLNQQQQKVLQNALRDFHLSGVDLSSEKKKQFRENSQKLSRLTTQFEENLLDATQHWQKQICDEKELSGLPESALALAAQTAQQRDQEGWLLTLDFPSYFPLMSYCDNRPLRQEMYQAYMTRASDLGADSAWDNSRIMDEILAVRHQQAQLLGFDNYAEKSLATKMARSTDEVMAFLNDLAQRSKAQGEKEFEELQQFARREYGQDELQPWDVAWFAEKLRQQRYDISPEILRPYFPLKRVLSGLFEIVSRLYGLTITESRDFDSWHEDVQFFSIHDGEGRLRGEFYTDLYARQHKRGGAWMADCASRMRLADGLQTPVAFLTCNFSPPLGDQPALLTHDEVETLFHEFGHGLHHLLTQVDYSPVSGINGVAWDAVELPSQFMENWCWEKQALPLISGHFESGEPLPDELYQRMLAAKNFQSGMQMLRQLEFSLFDFRIHLEYDPQAGGRIYEILQQVRKQVAVVPQADFNRFAHGFSHIFAGGYAAGYYSYKWAEVLSADAFSLFEEKGVFDAASGERFLHNILEQGGAKDARDLFTAFRGREPQIDALLRHSGIAA